MQMLPAVTLACLSAPLEDLYLWFSCEDSATKDPLAAVQLAPLGALRQLKTLVTTGIDSFQPLLPALRHLTALTHLSLSVNATAPPESAQCGVLEVAASALTQLEEIELVGSWRTTVQRLPDAMSRLTRLRQLETLNVKVVHKSNALTG